mgnify:CR=1 FL=1
MDGKRIGEVIDDLRTATEDMPMPASPKQISYAKSLAESLEMDESAACELVGLSNFSELTGGKSGTASELIGNLKGKVDSTPRPPSPKQLNFIKNFDILSEYDIITSFLPKQLSEEETKKICENLISKLGASSIKDMGKVMGELKKQHSDEIDFSKAGALLKQLLNK